MTTPPPTSKGPYYIAVAISQAVMFIVWAGLSYGAYWWFDGNHWFWVISIFCALDIAYEMWKEPIKEER